MGPTTVFPYGYEKYLNWAGLNDAVRTVQANQNLPQDGLDGLLRSAGEVLRSLMRFGIPGAAAAEDGQRPTFNPEPVRLTSDLMVTSGDMTRTRNFIAADWFALALYMRNNSPKGLRRLDSYDQARDFFTFAKKKEHQGGILYFAATTYILGDDSQSRALANVHTLVT